MSCRAPAAAYLATSVLPSSAMSGGLLPAYAVSSLVVTSDHCWIWTSTVTFGYLALKSALTASTIAWGALPFMSQTVRVPLGWLVVLLCEEEHPATASSAPKSATSICLGLTRFHLLNGFELAPSAPAPRRRHVRASISPPPLLSSSRCPPRPRARPAGPWARELGHCGHAGGTAPPPAGSGRRDIWSARTRPSDRRRWRSCARTGGPASAAARR